MTAERFRAYESRERATLGGGVAAGGATALLGDPDDVVGQVRGLAERLPVGPLIVRAQWPGMDDDDVCAYLDRLGECVVRPLAERS
jgi:hypothetical protein